MSASPLPDGVYLDLPDERYFGQPRLGSTDLKVLHEDPSSWWYGSRLNPDRAEKKRSEEMEFGSALHALVLEGEEVYSKRCVVRPSTYFDTKTGEEKPWHGGASVCKEWMLAHDKPGRIILTEDMDRRVRHMAALILHHPELGEPMRGGLSEVTVLWTSICGVQLRAKFDKLLPRFVVDLKSYGGDAKGRSVRDQCLNLVVARSMDVQRYLYFQGRQKMAELIAAGALHGGNDHQREWITKAAQIPADGWQWAWIFYRRRDDERPYAPIVKPIVRSNPDVTWETGRQKVEVALQNYHAFRERFGDTAWAVVEPTEEPDDTEFPHWITQVREPVTFPDLSSEAA